MTHTKNECADQERTSNDILLTLKKSFRQS